MNEIIITNISTTSNVPLTNFVACPISNKRLSKSPDKIHNKLIN